MIDLLEEQNRLLKEQTYLLNEIIRNKRMEIECLRLRVECAESVCSDIAKLVGYEPNSLEFGGDALVKKVRSLVDSCKS